MLNHGQRTISVSGKECSVLFEFDVMYIAWECDSKAWIVLCDGVKRVVHSDHGSKYFSNVKELEEFIESYEEATKQARHAISLMNGAE